MLAGAALADPIEGNWKTKTGETAAIAGCGGAFCITLKTGEYAGKSIGKMSADRRRQLRRLDHQAVERQDL